MCMDMHSMYMRSMCICVTSHGSEPGGCGGREAHACATRTHAPHTCTCHPHADATRTCARYTHATLRPMLLQVWRKEAIKERKVRDMRRRVRKAELLLHERTFFERLAEVGFQRKRMGEVTASPRYVQVSRWALERPALCTSPSLHLALSQSLALSKPRPLSTSLSLHLALSPPPPLPFSVLCSVLYSVLCSVLCSSLPATSALPLALLLSLPLSPPNNTTLEPRS